MFHVPNFKLNLIYVGHFTKALNCGVTFFLSYCIFQDLKMGKTIGQGHGDQRLYLMDDLSPIVSTVQ